jgi:hypothetical protein
MAMKSDTQRSITVTGIFTEISGIVTVRAVGDNVHTLTGQRAIAKLSSAIHFRKVAARGKHRR